MIILKKNQNQNQNIFFFKGLITDIQIFYIDTVIPIPSNIHINTFKNKLYFKYENNILLLKHKNIIFFKKNNSLQLFLFDVKTNKNQIKLYITLINLKIKGLLQKYKLNLHLNGIGYKSFIKNNTLILKLGFSHLIVLQIPVTIQIINLGNKLILNSFDLIFLTQFVCFVKNFKLVEPYKGKGLILNSEIIIKKEGKKSKK